MPFYASKPVYGSHESRTKRAGGERQAGGTRERNGSEGKIDMGELYFT